MFKKQAISADKALVICQTICSKREQCYFDIEKKLVRWKIEEIARKQILDNLRSEKFIDDARYAKSFTNDKYKYGHWGKNKIKYQLKQKKISDLIIRESLAQIDEDDYQVILTELLRHKKERVKARDSFEQKRKLAAFALNRGFEMDLIFRVLNDIYIDTNI